MSSTKITYSDLVKALAAAEDAGPVSVDGMTVAEWGEVWDVGADTARKRIKQALDAGLMKKIRTLRTNLLGRDCPTQVYQLVTGENECEQTK